MGKGTEGSLGVGGSDGLFETRRQRLRGKDVGEEASCHEPTIYRGLAGRAAANQEAWSGRMQTDHWDRAGTGERAERLTRVEGKRVSMVSGSPGITGWVKSQVI